MESKLTVREKIEKVRQLLNRADAYLIEEDNARALREAYSAEELLTEAVIGLEDLEMIHIDFAGINLDEAFADNPISDYILAGVDYAVSGDESALERRKEAASRISGTQVVSSEEGATSLLNNLLDREEALAVQLEKDLVEIERVLEGTKIDDWTEDQVELARFHLQFQPETTMNEVEALTPYGVKLAWKRRRYFGATK